MKLIVASSINNVYLKNQLYISQCKKWDKPSLAHSLIWMQEKYAMNRDLKFASCVYAKW